MGRIDKKSRSNNETKVHKTVFYIAIIIFLVVCSFVGFIFGIPQYGSALLRCGGAPIAVNYHFAEYKVDYSKPGDPSYPGPDMFIKYVCTEQEALNLGATHLFAK